MYSVNIRDHFSCSPLLFSWPALQNRCGQTERRGGEQLKKKKNLFMQHSIKIYSVQTCSQHVQHKNCNQTLNCKQHHIRVSKSDLIKAQGACKVWGHSKVCTSVTFYCLQCPWWVTVHNITLWNCMLNCFCDPYCIKNWHFALTITYSCVVVFATFQIPLIYMSVRCALDCNAKYMSRIRKITIQ